MGGATNQKTAIVVGVYYETPPPATTRRLQVALQALELEESRRPRDWPRQASRSLY